MVLGFSKGSTQVDYFEQDRFDDVAFAGMRSRLNAILRHFNILDETTSLDDVISDPNGRIAFGSLIRCSVTRRNETTGKQECSGDLIVKAFSEIPAIIDTCASQFLMDLPSSVRAVMLLGSNTQYIRKVQEKLQWLFSDTYKQINDVAVQADGKVWVHVAHPSGANGHFSPWLHDDGAAGHKRRLAEEALRFVGKDLHRESTPELTTNESQTAPHVAKDMKRAASSERRTLRTATVEEAEALLAETLPRTAPPTKYIAGFRARNGRELALERSRSRGIYVWAETLNPGREEIEIINSSNPGMPYAPTQSRNSNLNGKNAPRLKQGNAAYYLRFAGLQALKQFVDWYQSA